MRVGAYEVTREIGRGSMGAVYLATRPGLDRTFALKVMNRTALADPEAVQRFRREARLASRIDHPGVIPVVDAGEVDGVPFYVMGHCEGDTLQAVLRRGPLPALDAARIVRDLADAVAAAHAVGCLHRDLKPANVIVEATSGRPRITDFGLARDSSAADRLTRTGEVLGTPFYMAPEQVRGDKSADHRVDVYALGVILYECLSGAHPYEGPSSAVVAREILGGRPVPLRSVRRDVPAGLDAIVDCAIAPDRESRFGQASEMRAALQAFIEQGGVEPERRLGRFAVGLLVFTFGLVLLTAGVVVTVVLRERARADEKRRVEAESAERLAAREREDRERAAREAAAHRAAEQAAADAAAKAALEEQRRQENPDLTGRWTGVYRGHGEEVIAIKHEGDRVVATKITGDENVPAGEITWRATLKGKEGEGEGRVGFGRSGLRFIPGQLTVIDADTVDFTWGVFATIRFKRAK